MGADVAADASDHYERIQGYGWRFAFEVVIHDDQGSAEIMDYGSPRRLGFFPRFYLSFDYLVLAVKSHAMIITEHQRQAYAPRATLA